MLNFPFNFVLNPCFDNKPKVIDSDMKHKNATSQDIEVSCPSFGLLITSPSPPIEPQDYEEKCINFNGTLSNHPTFFILRSSEPTLSSSNQIDLSTLNHSNEKSSPSSPDEINEGSYLNHLNSIQARDESKSRRRGRRRPRTSSKKTGGNRNRSPNQSTRSRKKD